MSHPPADYVWFAVATPYIVGAVVAVLLVLFMTAVFGTVLHVVGRRDDRP